MLKSPALDAIVFYVKDIRRAEVFYRDVLGLETKLMPAHDDDDAPWMRADVGKTTFVFFQRDEKPGRTPIVVFGLEQGGIDDIVEQLVAKNVQIVAPVSESPGGWSADFLDPDGHVLALYQSEKSPRRL